MAEVDVVGRAAHKFVKTNFRSQEVFA
jgi:hypothetical protein